MRIVIAAIVGWLSISTSFAQSNTPKYSNEFLAIGVNARALGMASAFTAVANDVSAGYWNPSGLTQLEYQYDVSVMHAQYFAGIANYDYLGFATKIDSVSSLGLSVIRFGIDDIPDTRFLYDANGALNYDNIQFFSASDYAFLFSYARKLDWLGGLDVGGNAKIIYRHAGNFATAWGYGIDLSATKSFKNLQLAVMLKDITGTYNAWSHNTELVADIYTQTGNVIPENSIEITLPRAVIGASYTFAIKQKFGLLLALDLETTTDGKRNTLIKTNSVSIDPRFGLEASYLSLFFLRFGAGQFQEIQNFDRSTSMVYQPNFGIGVKLKNFNIDYALTDIGDQAETPYSHVISLKLGFDDKK
ncbi:PorV/PorQ family protein [Reichenbachiella carrageenanivorans]|uniref:PorV/PorQ family protein n=1 Tax=Reichenbachiella carrageenanivorans TaxID=2979869 RepID=A0ABY6CYJ0_9BACT|nr:PorV/PorQ family protein [Reichenbachiella carrageenanivorans]UXX78991.1 PorV/PorQ family protein [Reichenbachiella carrageenanivorans]